MTSNLKNGFSLVELMVALTLALMLSIGVLGVYIAQVNTYKTNISQSTTQNAISAISALMAPTIRSAGFCGCATIRDAISNLKSGGPPPLGTLSTTASMMMGYDAAAGTVINITQNNPPNATNANLWSPNLHTSLTGKIESVSDVLIVLGPTPGSSPTAVTLFIPSNVNFRIQNPAGITKNTFAAISDCSKATVFQVTAIGGTTITHATGGGTMDNASNTFTVNYPIGAQFIQLSQTAFFVAKDQSGQSALLRASFNADGTWTLQSLVPDVESMQVLYGIGANDVVSQYVPASGVTNWSQVYAVRLGFLLEGQAGSGAKTPTSYNVLGTTINVPSDNRMRHVFEMTINLRNSNS